jgi:hypothetical protein
MMITVQYDGSTVFNIGKYHMLHIDTSIMYIYEQLSYIAYTIVYDDLDDFIPLTR